VSPFEFSARAGFASDYIYRGVTLSDHKPAVGAGLEAMFGLFYAGATVTSVNLPTRPAAEITMNGGLRPKLGDVQFDFGWTSFSYPGETAPVGGTAGIDYWEAAARADTRMGETLHLAGGFAYSPTSRTRAHGASTLHSAWASTSLAMRCRRMSPRR
jgi:uncharacterized protein (TIGR02001 family)